MGIRIYAYRLMFVSSGSNKQRTQATVERAENTALSLSFPIYEVKMMLLQPLSTSELRLFLCELAERALTEKRLIHRTEFRYALAASRQYAHTPTRKAFQDMFLAHENAKALLMKVGFSPKSQRYTCAAWVCVYASSPQVHYSRKAAINCYIDTFHPDRHPAEERWLRNRENELVYAQRDARISVLEVLSAREDALGTALRQQLIEEERVLF